MIASACPWDAPGKAASENDLRCGRRRRDNALRLAPAWRHAGAKQMKDLHAVRTKRLALNPLHYVRHRHKLAAHDLLRLQLKRPVMIEPIDHAVRETLRSAIPER